MKIINPIQLREWDDFVIHHEDATIFHTAAWARVLAETYRYEPKYFAKYHHGKIVQALPMMEINSILTGKRGVSLPFTDFCPPLLSDMAELPLLLDESAQLGRQRGWKRIELRGLNPEDLDAPPAITYLTHDLDLKNNDAEMKAGINDSTRRNIQKALRLGVEVTEQNSLDGMRRFHLLNRVTRKRHGLPPQPFSFFHSIYRNIISKGLGSLLLGVYEGKCVAGAMFFQHRDHVLFKYGASGSRYHHLRPNDLVMWEAIRLFSARNLRRLNFGRTDLGHQGLRRFKLGWGSKETALSYFSYDLNLCAFIRKTVTVKEWQRRTMKKLPVSLLGVIGSVLYRHVG